MLYHRQVFWKYEFDEQSISLVRSATKLSNHLWRHIDHPNMKHNIDLTQLSIAVRRLSGLNKVEPFEVEVIGDKVVKCVIRTKYNATKDISIVFVDGMIVTAWLNNVDDDHFTLNDKRYESS